MWKHQYEVTLQTPIGERHGHMAVTIDNSQIDGVLTILKKAAPFHGILHEDGNCLIKGELFTLMQTIAYEATGEIKEESLHLTLKGSNEIWELSGTAVDSPSSQEKEAL